MEFAVGHELNHPEYGPGIVSFVGDDYIGIEFGDGNEALLRREALADALSEGKVKSSQSALVESAPPRPPSTFVNESDDAQHFMGSHWDPFVDDANEILGRLPTIVNQAKLVSGYDDSRQALHQDHQDWMQGSCLAWPDVSRGVMAVIAHSKNSNELFSLFPFFARGSRVKLRLEQVTVWKKGVEAQIDAEWSEAPVTFFDSHFVVNRSWYQAGKYYEFVLIGIAYSAGVATVGEIPYTPNPDQVAWQRTLAEKRGEAPPEVPETISLAGMSMFLPVEEWDVDDYQFRGRVKHVEPFEDVLGQDGWCVTVPVMRFGDEDADLCILITRRVWLSDEPPVVGQDIDGRLWLQGRLSSVLDDKPS